MSKPKLLITSSIVVLLAFVAAGGWVWNGQKNNLANIQKGSIAKVDTSNWPTHQIEKLGLSVRMPPVYKQSSLAQEHNVDGYFSTWNDEDTRDYEKHRFDYNGNDGEVPEPSFIKIKKSNINIQSIDDAVPAVFKQPLELQTTKYIATTRKLKSLMVAGHPAIITEAMAGGSLSYKGYIKLEGGVLEISNDYLTDYYSFTFEEFEAMVKSINF